MNIHRHDFDGDRNINVLRRRFKERQERKRMVNTYLLQAAAVALVTFPILYFGFDWVRDEGILSMVLLCTFVAGGLIGRSSIGMGIES